MGFFQVWGAMAAQTTIPNAFGMLRGGTAVARAVIAARTWKNPTVSTKIERTRLRLAQNERCHESSITFTLTFIDIPIGRIKLSGVFGNYPILAQDLFMPEGEGKTPLEEKKPTP